MKIIDADELEIENDVAQLKGEYFTGSAYTKYPNGTLESITSYLVGLQHGWIKTWGPAGEPFMQTLCYHAFIHGPDREWSDDGQLVLEDFKTYGKSLTSKRWNENGELLKDYSIDVNDNTILEHNKRMREFIGAEIPLEAADIHSQPSAMDWWAHNKEDDHMKIPDSFK